MGWRNQRPGIELRVGDIVEVKPNYYGAKVAGSGLLVKIEPRPDGKTEYSVAMFGTAGLYCPGMLLYPAEVEDCFRVLWRSPVAEGEEAC